MPKAIKYHFLIIVSLLFSADAFSIQRFPKPDFESGYTQPPVSQPLPRAEILGYLDILVLFVALLLVTWLVLKRRSRMGVYLTSLISLAYFGFYRQGCVCSIGSIQNVTLAVFDGTYALPVTVLSFFLLPLIFTLFTGRTFCAGVCPFGAMQDLVAFSPMKIGTRLNTVLGVIPYIYLGFAILYAATGTDFIICRYDPFVGIFRLNASFGMFVFAGILLLLGIFIARPYCRFLCPYGVLLNWMSRFSWKHMTITPSHCIQCRLCEDSCPYDAINIPVIEKNPESRQTRRRKLMLLSILIPLLVFIGAWTMSGLSEMLASVNPKVALIKQLEKDSKDESFEIQAFKSSGKQLTAAYSEAKSVVKEFKTGSLILGGFLGLTFGLLIAGRMIRKYNPDYVPDKARCYSCARCIDYCPVIKDIKV